MKSESPNAAANSVDPGWLAEAKAQGLLPSHAALEGGTSRPWPVVLLTAFGAWLAGLPLLGLIVLTAGDFLTRSPGSCLVLGGLVIAASIAVLRLKDLPLFLEQFAVPGLWAGVAAMAWGFEQYMPTRVWLGMLALLLFAVALLLPGTQKAWLRTLLGASSMVLLFYGLALVDRSYGDHSFDRYSSIMSPWLAIHLLAVTWMVWHLYGTRLMGQVTSLPAFASGWVIAALAVLAWTSGRSFLIGGGLGMNEGGGELQHEWSRSSFWLTTGWRRAVSAALVLLGAWSLTAWFVRLSKGNEVHFLKRPLIASSGVAVVLALLAWFMPNLGMVLLIAAFMLRAQRNLLGVLASLVAAWIIGSFYYHLTWPLATKAVVLVCATAVLAGLAFVASRLRRQSSDRELSNTVQKASSWLRPALLLATTVATLGVANTAIWQKEQLITEGKPVFVRLAPRDPRSLMQGDYMALNFALPEEFRERTKALSLTGAQRPFAVGKLAETGELKLTRVVLNNEAIAGDETKIELSPKDGEWTLVTDAWFFKEGDATRWEQARFGEFRVMADGRALLVGMADEKLNAIKP